MKTRDEKIERLLASSPMVEGYNLLALKSLLIALANGKVVKRGYNKEFAFGKRG